LNFRRCAQGPRDAYRVSRDHGTRDVAQSRYETEQCVETKTKTRTGKRERLVEHPGDGAQSIELTQAACAGVLRLGIHSA
jgi:hypothetical protein